MDIDYLIVGSGISGAVIARKLQERGHRVLVVDRRAHMGGNMHDHTHPSGIRIHTYGPHLFRTSSEEIWDFVNSFAAFYPYEHEVKSLVDGKYENWPVAGSYIRATLGANWKSDVIESPSNFEEACLSMMPRPIYEKFVKGYTEKQWGVPAASLWPKLAGRFTVHEDDDPRLKKCKYQGLPLLGYASLMENIFKGIPLLLNFDYLKHRAAFSPKVCTVFTGCIDEYFEYEFGKLEYRTQKREVQYLPDVHNELPGAVINYPSTCQGDYVRRIEWKYMMPKEEASRIRGTVVSSETPIRSVQEGNHEYPFPDQRNQDLYQKYRQKADEIPNLLICGRLGEYRYFDMDQAIARAMMLVERILLKPSPQTNNGRSNERCFSLSNLSET